MTHHPTIAPVAELGAALDPALLQSEIHQMETLLALLRKRTDLACELAVHGVNWASRPLSPADIKAMVGRRRGVSVEEIDGQGATRPVVEARHEAMYLMRAQKNEDGSTRWSFPEIGRCFGGRDHSTAWQAIGRHAERLRAIGLVDTAERPRPAKPQAVGRVG